MGVPTTVEGEDFRQPHLVEPEPTPAVIASDG